MPPKKRDRRDLMSVADDVDDDMDLPMANGRGKVRSNVSRIRQREETLARAEIMSLLMAGLSQEQIAERRGIAQTDVSAIVARALAASPRGGVETMRAVENMRLDRAQAAIWTDVLEGDTKAINDFLRISARRSRLNGLDAPFQIELSARVRIEMEEALTELQEIVLGEVIPDDGRGETEGPEAFA